PVSGESIARELNISRAAVWKRIEKLRKEGFKIDAHPKSGYLLTASPDKLIPEEMENELQETIFSKKIVFYKKLESTNLTAKRLAVDGALEGTVVITEEQTMGRGRLNRKWLSPPERNILFSIIFRPKFLFSQLFSLTMLTSLSIVKAIEKITGLNPMIKWPNDIYLGRLKAGGILTEFNGEHDQINFVVVGVGLNVNFDPSLSDEIQNIATSISKELGEKISRIKLLCAILKEIEKYYSLICKNKLHQIHQEWNNYSLVTGKPVTITSFNSTENGIAESVDADGSLVFRDLDGKRKKIVCGDVSLGITG
ncbi:MAG: biotin--[acetyl-CoA-carboxylase] ligase, partial [Desulfosarcina sp.]|nr:biotin--[acetyl-CoA-carboxylase] ligase [Desulfobacterales bacterium]